MKIPSQRADLTSVHRHDYEFSELVWENGQVFVQSLPRKTQESKPSFVNVDLMKKKFGTVDSSLDHESLYPTHFDMFLEPSEGNSCDKNLADPQIVPVNEYANVRLGSASNCSREIPQLATTRNTQCQASAPLKRPRVVSTTNLVSVEEEQDLESDRKREKEVMNFSLFLRSSVQRNGGVTVPTNTTAGSSRANVEVSPPTTSSAKPPKNSVPDNQSEAVCRDGYGEFTAKEKLMNTKKSMEPCPLASSSLCSRGASNNTIYNNLKRRYHEDTEESAYLSDQNVEENLENARKQVHARGGAGTRRKPTAEAHNQSERKQRDKINKKMRALQELIPNCNKVDEASMLDEAIQYLKTLQLQVQMMWMGSGVCMPQMMIPTRMQQMHHALQMAHLSAPMSMRMHMGAVGCSPPQFLVSPIAASTAVPEISQNRFQMPAGFAVQPLPHMSPLFHAPPGLLHKTVPLAAISRNQKVNYLEEMNNAKPECSYSPPSI